MNRKAEEMQHPRRHCSLPVCNRGHVQLPRTRLPLAAAVLATLLTASLVCAQVPNIALQHAECFPRAENGVAYALIAPEAGGTATRLYFRWQEDEDFYWVKMNAEGGGRYWGVPPKPDEDNEAIEYYVAVVDPLNQVLAKSANDESPVEDECEVELTERQLGVSENLTVGETTFEQVGEEVDGFLCDGVVTRINPDGVRRSDERCRACVIVWWEKKGILIPFATAGSTVSLIDINELPEASPATPVISDAAAEAP